MSEIRKVVKQDGAALKEVLNSIELFPAASYQYVMYGMGFKPDFNSQAYLYKEQQQATRILQQNQTITAQLLRTLPPHRQYIQQWLANSR